MNETSNPESAPVSPSRQEELAALFGNLVVQQANMALMLMGKVPNPESGERMKDLEAARFFVDQLEMIEVKTRGNLSPQEAHLLKQTLMTLRLAFVEAVEEGDTPPEAAGATPQPETAPSPAPAEANPPADDDSKKKFTKKY